MGPRRGIARRTIEASRPVVPTGAPWRAVQPRDPARVEHLLECPIVGMHQLDTLAPGCERCTRSRERVGVAVEADHARGAGVEQGPGMTAEADRAVDEQAAALGPEKLD